MSNQEDKNVIREFWLSSFAIDNRTSIFVITLMILIFGMVTYSSMPRESFPEVTQPEIYIGTTYPGNSPEDIENLITRPIEKELKSLTGVDEISSTSVQDYSTILVSFDFDVPVGEALLDVKDAVDIAKAELPTDLDTDPNIFELDFTDFPIMNINLSGNLTMEQLRDHAEFLQDEIEQLGEIKEVEIRGLLEQEVNILVENQKMESMLISYRDIEDAMFQENITMSGGDVLADGYRRNLRVIGEFKSIKEIEEIIVKRENGDIVFLKDIAEVEFGYEDRKSYARLDGLDVVTLDVKKQGGENIIRASEKINEIIDEAKKNRFPQEMIISITNDQSVETKIMVKDLENNIISGVILVVLVLLFFLGLRNALFVGIAIPLSMLLGILWLGLSGTTLNMMVLFSLIMALGMLVDNGIVVVENIYRLLSEGKPIIRAAKEGVGEVAFPIISSTATTLSAFTPLLFWKSTMGEFMKYLPLTLILVLGASLFVGLVINPVLTSVFMKVDEEQGAKNSKRFWMTIIGMVLLSAVFFLASYYELGPIGTLNTFGSIFAILAVMIILNKFVLDPLSHRFRNVFMRRLERVYEKVLTGVLKGYRPLFIFIFALIATVASAGYYFSHATVVFFPSQDPLYVNIFIEMPLGTDIEQTDELTRELEVKVNKVVEPYRDIVEAVLAQVGEGTADPMDGPSTSASPNKARINVSFLEYFERGGISTTRIMEELRRELKDVPGAEIIVDQNPVGPPTGKPINIEVTGDDFEELISISEFLLNEINDLEIDGIERLQLDLETGKPELIVDIDRAAARRFGMSTVQIAGDIRTALFGKEISKYKLGEDDYPIMLRSADDTRYDLNALLNKKITFQNISTGRWLSVPISAVADIRYSSSLGSVKRKDLKRAITISSNVTEGYNPTEINLMIEEHLKTLDLPTGYDYAFTGEQQEQEESMAFLSMAMGIAVFLIFLIIVSQFNSIITPAIILFSVLFSTIGVFIGLIIFNMPFVAIMTGIGIISLAGIVVNNAIVLIDYTNLIRERRRAELGLNESDRLPMQDVVYSIVKGGETRLRPVLLTAITTVLGLIPLAVGININFGTLVSEFDPKFFLGGDNVAFWGPMSWTIIFGLTFSTFLTLLVVPCMYLLSDKLKDRIMGIKRKRALKKEARRNKLAGA